MSSHMAHGVHASTVPGIPHSNTTQSQSAIPSSSSNTKQGVHLNTAHTNRPQGSGTVQAEGIGRTGSGHRHGKSNLSGLGLV